MALYQLMVEHADEHGAKHMVQSGKTNPNLKRLVTRLKTKRRGWIQLLNADTTKTVVKARGFSKHAMAAIKSCGVSIC